MISPIDVNPLLEKKNETTITEYDTLSKIIRRSNVTAMDVVQLITDDKIKSLLSLPEINQQVEIDMKYEGYILRQNEQINRFAKFEEHLIPEHFDYTKISSLSVEGKEKLHRVRPRSIGQASRISGVTNSDVSVLSIFIKQMESQTSHNI